MPLRRACWTALTWIMLGAPVQALEVSYNALSLLKVPSEPRDVWVALSRAKRLATFDCWLGGRKTRCYLPAYSREQLKPLAALTDVLSDERLRSAPLERLLRDVLADYDLRHRAGVFVDGPLPIFPTRSFVDGPHGKGAAAEVARAPVFDRTRFATDIGSLMLRNLRDVNAVRRIQDWPVSYEMVEVDPLFGQAWASWNQLAGESERVCSDANRECPEQFLLFRYKDGPADRESGFALCRFRSEQTRLLGSLSDCTVMAFQTRDGQRYVKVAYGPIIGIDSGGPIGAGGVVEISCPTKQKLSLDDMRRSARKVLDDPRYKLSMPEAPKYANPRRVISGLNDGNALELFGGKFTFLQVDVDAYDDVLFLRMIARAHVRAEKSPSVYPVVSVEEANVLTKSLIDGFRKLAFECESLHDQ